MSSRSIIDPIRERFESGGNTLTEAEQEVFEHAATRQPIARDSYSTYVEGASWGARLADAIARVGGSWAFILAFIGFLAVWTATNVWLPSASRLDPYPFIFLNLILSMLAALQAPIIMMSQNRQAERDRIDAAHDYQVNLKAEIEIMALHEKFDELRHRDIIAMRGEIAALADALRRLDERLAAGQARP
jgi:uncharacterized membrane protein